MWCVSGGGQGISNIGVCTGNMRNGLGTRFGGEWRKGVRLGCNSRF